eukprot:1153556-Alexandrium_andersonii.AAC.1
MPARAHACQLGCAGTSVRAGVPGRASYQRSCVPECLCACVPVCLRACACLRACIPSCLCVLAHTPVCLRACAPARVRVRVWELA